MSALNYCGKDNNEHRFYCDSHRQVFTMKDGSKVHIFEAIYNSLESKLMIKFNRYRILPNGSIGNKMSKIEEKAFSLNPNWEHCFLFIWRNTCLYRLTELHEWSIGICIGCSTRDNWERLCIQVG